MSCIAIALTASALVGGCSNGTGQVPAAGKGFLDLSSWDFSANGPADLAGEWEIYWNRFLSPEEFRGAAAPGPAGYIFMPGFWNGQTVSGRTLPGHGYATMRLTVHLGKRHPLFSMKVPHMYTAYRLWVSGKLASSNGVTGTGRAEETPQFLPRTIVLTPESDTLELVVQVSNFHHPKGGMWAPLQLGADTQLINTQRYLDWLNTILFGGLLLMAIYHISIFMMRKTDRASLFFGIFCLIVALRVLFEGDRMIIELFPAISWEINEKMSYLTTYGAVLIISLSLYYLYPDIYRRTVLRVCVITYAILCVTVIVLTSQYYFYTRYVNYLGMALWGAYDIYVIGRAIVLRRQGAAYIIGGMVFLLAAVCVDVLYHERVIMVGNVLSAGVFLFTISQALLLSDRSSKAMKSIETLSAEKASLFSGSIDIITSLLLASSTRLYESTRNVARISLMLARRAGVPEEGLEDIRIAALLHDIGMVGMPDDLVTSPHGISDAERQIVESHPRKSIEIIETLKELGVAKQIISQHHERYDGSGYPSRLAGNDIVLGARIICLVDDFVAMLGRREFQDEDKKERIMAELERRKGLLYDPDLVDELVRLMHEKNLVYHINEDDIRYLEKDDVSEWVFPSNVNFEQTVVKKIITEVQSRVPIDSHVSDLAAAGLGEIIRNAIIHGNKYDESKPVVVTLRTREKETGTTLLFRVTDEGSGMDLTGYTHYKESRIRLYEIMREMKQVISTLESPGAKDVCDGLSRKLQSFLMDNYINYNRYRHIDAPEGTAGIGLIQVMQTFDSVEFHNIITNNTLSGLEVVLELHLDRQPAGEP